MKSFSSFVLIASALILAGCGSGSSDADSASEAVAESTDQAVEESVEPSEAESQNSQADANTAGGDEPESGGEFQSVEAIGMTLAWRVSGEMLEVELTGPTTGWIAVGFKPRRAMLEGNIHIGYVEGSNVVMTDQWGQTMTSHRPDTDLGGTSDVEMLSGSDDGASTTISFRIPLDSGDEFDQPLASGETIPVILAYGPNGEDNTTAYHAGRAGIEITL